MGSIIEAIIDATGWSEKIARAVAYVSLALAIAGAIGAGKCVYDHSVITKHETQVAQRAAPATDQAATERASDTIAITKHEQELHDVIAAEPDQPIAPSSHALACKRLRDAGRDPPACR